MSCNYLGKALIGIVPALALVSACSSESTDLSSTTLFDENTPQAGGDNVAEIAGIWDESAMEDGLLDVKYWVINANGTFAEVDYRGDDFDNDENCYDIFRGVVTSNGPGTYAFDTPYPNNPQITHRLKVVDGQLTIFDRNGEPGISFPLVPGGLDSSIPEC